MRVLLVFGCGVKYNIAYAFPGLSLNLGFVVDVYRVDPIVWEYGHNVSMKLSWLGYMLGNGKIQ